MAASHIGRASEVMGEAVKTTNRLDRNGLHP